MPTNRPENATQHPIGGSNRVAESHITGTIKIPSNMNRLEPMTRRIMPQTDPRHRKTGEFQRDDRTPGGSRELHVRSQRIVQDKLDNFVIDFGELLDELCSFLRGNLVERTLGPQKTLTLCSMTAWIEPFSGQGGCSPCCTLLIDSLPPDKVNHTLELILHANGDHKLHQPVYEAPC
ncbi:hypothetical protein BJV78DRAFT_1192893 [Lactifluus subvellereus]|nr:hypothetical protein BJV78DRAFT_1192893 [Lactifluus subvellereus]